MLLPGVSLDFPEKNLNPAGLITLDKHAMSTTAKPTSVSHTSAKTTSVKPTSTKSKSTKSTNMKSKGPKPASPWRFYDLRDGINMNLVAAQLPDLSVIRILNVPTRHSTSRLLDNSLFNIPLLSIPLLSARLLNTPSHGLSRARTTQACGARKGFGKPWPRVSNRDRFRHPRRHLGPRSSRIRDRASHEPARRA